MFILVKGLGLKVTYFLVNTHADYQAECIFAKRSARPNTFVKVIIVKIFSLDIQAVLKVYKHKNISRNSYKTIWKRSFNKNYPWDDVPEEKQAKMNSTQINGWIKFPDLEYVKAMY